MKNLLPNKNLLQKKNLSSKCNSKDYDLTGPFVSLCMVGWSLVLIMLGNTIYGRSSSTDIARVGFSSQFEGMSYSYTNLGQAGLVIFGSLFIICILTYIGNSLLGD